ncbi:MAG: hypothetical protein IMZ75_13355 [Actinobacteria bacterium]|nr:hypothetical protein [Actinomycetota bacterium]
MRGLFRSVAVVAAGAGLVLGATYLPAPINVAQRTRPGPATNASAEPVTQTQSICPGPEALGIKGLRDSMAQTVSVTAVAAPVTSLPAGFAVGRGAGSLTISGLPSGEKWAGPVTIRGQVIGGQILTARSALITGAGAMAPGTVATQWSWTKTRERRGLVTAACMPAAVSSWLIAGGAGPGRLERLVLTNPGPNPLTVDVTVFGVKGPIESPNGHDLVVGGHARIVVLLDTIAGSEQSPVVHVTAQGGEVAAVLSDTWLDGVVPRGGDDAVSVAAPAREQVIAGVPIEGRAILRVAVPGDSEAVVESRVLTPGGPRALPSNGVTRVAGHRTKDIDLSSLAPGAYAVQVRGDVPVVAAVMVDRRRAVGAPSDLAWSVASVPIRTLAGMALPSSEVKGLIQRLDLAATRDPASVLVTTVGAGGQVSTKEVAIAADSVSTLSLNGATSVWVTPRTGLVRAAVLTTATDVGGVLLSVTPLADLTLTTTPLPLRQLRD